MERRIIRKILINILWIMGIVCIISLFIKNKTDEIFLKKSEEADKFHSYYNTLVKWMELIQNNQKIADYFKKEDVIAIYGMGTIGEFISSELLKNNRNVICGIDKNIAGKNMKTGLKIYSIEDCQNIKIDYIIISIPYLADEIVPMLNKDNSLRIVTIDEVIDTLLMR